MKASKWMGLMIVTAVLLGAACALIAGESKYASGTTSAGVTFGPATGQTVVESVYATSDKVSSAVKFYARGGAGKVAPTSSPALAATNILVSNTSYALTNNDHVVYVHANGTVLHSTISSCSTTNIGIANALAVAGASGDYVYEVTQQGEIIVGFYGTGTGTNDTLATSGTVFVSPGDSPVYVVLDGTGTAKLQVTVDK